MRGATRDHSNPMPFNKFQSTLLMRGATFLYQSSTAAIKISIHAPHARSDGSKVALLAAPLISIHAPHARSDSNQVEYVLRYEFQSTLLMRGATVKDADADGSARKFQSTLLMRGATSIILGEPVEVMRFQSTLLMRGATCGEKFIYASANQFQSTLLMRGATMHLPESLIDVLQISIHAPHARSDSTTRRTA